ncbi:hypothetical protein FAF44_20385 [Nonomuraea sp. MG754425]|uniref:hypothetical protein n=1 Tax=Nonomuraea sp. MG754425 TaxID=2570319 RepID=UPI001F37E0AE|nr:hypothetical protein [Nonomuraea sp. MG754425]MCF6470732.1 hypothetical protein [Nonomuraea sp. MG754425]
MNSTPTATLGIYFAVHAQGRHGTQAHQLRRWSTMLSFRLIPPDRISLPIDVRVPLEDLEDYEYLVMTGSQQLGAAGYQFYMGGFGSENWNMDVEYDMSTLIEGLPSLLQSLQSTGAGEVDLYSQGIERMLRFQRCADLVEVTCISRMHWHPDPPLEIHNYADIEKMLTGLAGDFAQGLRRLSSPIAQLRPFVDWTN